MRTSSLPVPGLPFLGLLLLAACPRGPLSDVGAPDTVDRVYEVQFGDSMWGIASAYGVAGGYPRLAALNRIPNANIIAAGRKLRVPTVDTTLPEWPRVSRATESVQACAGEPLPPALRVALRGTDAAACIPLGPGSNACSVLAGGTRKLVVLRGPTMVWSHDIDVTPPVWFDPGSAAEPAATPTSMVATRYQLDSDGASEVVLAWKQEENDLGMSRWQVAIFDDAQFGRPPLTFEAANHGVGSVVKGAANGCEVLATEWLMADEPARQGDGWYLVGRRMAYAAGALHPRAGGEVLARRLLNTFSPAARQMGAVRVGAPAVDLARADARSTDPVVELSSGGMASGRIATATRDATGALSLTLTTRAGTVTQRVDARSNALRRLGDQATGIVYPVGYTPADPAQLNGKDVMVSSYQPPWWGDPWSVVWL